MLLRMTYYPEAILHLAFRGDPIPSAVRVAPFMPTAIPHGMQHPTSKTGPIAGPNKLRTVITRQVNATRMRRVRKILLFFLFICEPPASPYLDLFLGD
jgi:hypothetical protein